jgi:penicillin-binding protein 1A
VQRLVQRSTGLAVRLVLLAVIASATAGLVSVLVLPAAVFATQAVETVERDVFDVPPLPSAERLIENSFLYASDGSEIAEISFNESRLVVSLDVIPEDLINAVIATEDTSFWTHDGVNLESIARAAVGNVIAGEIQSGASTITQQFVKNTYIDQDRRSEQSYDRKLQEALWAVQIEQRLSKEEILEGYLNRIPLGQGVYGVGKASERYFSVPVQDLSLGQAATIAAMIRSPEGNNPLTNPDNARTRRDIVLSQMASEGFVSSDQAGAIIGTALELDARDPAATSEPWWVDFVTRQLYKQAAADTMGIPQDLLDALGATEEDRITSVFQTGLRIYTTLDPMRQAAAIAAITDNLTYDGEPREEVAREPFGGLVSVVPGDGAITTMAIGPVEYGSCSEPIGFDAEGRALCDLTKFNPLVPGDAGSTRTGRQPGSSFKPILITAALEAGFPPGWTADARSGQLIEGPAGCSNQEAWRPNNFGGGGDYLDMYSGVKASSNVFHAQLISEVGPAKVIDTAYRLGIFASEIKYACAIALGSGEVFPLEMATAYATLAARGMFCQPYAISRIETRAGKLLYEHTPDCKQTVDREVADRVIDIMRGPVTSGGTAPQITGQLSPHPVRGKTGTTQDYRDAWFVGYVPQLATAAWIGYPNGTTTFSCELNPKQCARVSNQCFEVNEAANTRGCVETRFLTAQTIGGQYRSRVFGGTIPAPMWSQYMRAALVDVQPGRFRSPGPQRSATVPDLSELLSIAEMREIVEGVGLRLFVLQVEDFRTENTYLRQLPLQDERVPAGSAVIVELSDAAGTQPLVPNFVGMTVTLATNLARESGFALVKSDRTSINESDQDIVLEQSIKAGDPYNPDELPNLELTVGSYDPAPQDEGSEPGATDDATNDDGTSDGAATDGTSDGGTTDGGTTDGGTTDGGTTDGGTSDGGTSDGDA